MERAASSGGRCSSSSFSPPSLSRRVGRATSSRPACSRSAPSRALSSSWARCSTGSAGSPDVDHPFTGFRFWLLVLELATVVAAALALRRFRFPPFVFVVAAASWFFVADLISGGGDWSAIVTIGVGLALLAAAVSVDRGSRTYGFWLHVASGLAIGGGLLWFFHDGNFDWILIAVARPAVCRAGRCAGSLELGRVRCLGPSAGDDAFRREMVGRRGIRVVPVEFLLVSVLRLRRVRRAQGTRLGRAALLCRARDSSSSGSDC